MPIEFHSLITYYYPNIHHAQFSHAQFRLTTPGEEIQEPVQDLVMAVWYRCADISPLDVAETKLWMNDPIFNTVDEVVRYWFIALRDQMTIWKVKFIFITLICETVFSSELESKYIYKSAELKDFSVSILLYIFIPPQWDRKVAPY